jgi:hypothetical protein
MLSIKDANLMLVDCLKLTSLECLGSERMIEKLQGEEVVGKEKLVFI